MSDLDKVRRYLRDQDRSYREFLSIVKMGCQDVAAALGGQVVLRVYDRTDKQGGEPLKDAAKVLEATTQPIRNDNLRKIADIIGVTVVVQYPDQIAVMLDKLKEQLALRQAVEENRKALTGAYFAVHATYRSTAVAHGNILCEVQCKTVLHDAWSAKMHDLTYKPLGTMDSRMKGLIEAISVSLEGLEKQSQIARDMILSRQRGEQKPFRASLAAFLSGVEGSLDSRQGQRDREVVELKREVEAFAAGAAADLRKRRAAQLNEKILRLLENDRTAGCAWLLAVRFAMALSQGEAARFLGNAAEGLIDRLAGLRAADLISEAELRAIPVGFYALQDFSRALEYVDRLLDQQATLNLSPDGLNILKFNKATWLLERESLRPSKPAVATAVRKEVDRLLAESKDDLTLKDEPGVRDTEGLRLIVYGTTKEEVRRGIDLCMAAGEPVEGDELESAVAIAYAEWRNHVGWRRYFELAEREVEADGA
jgi:hypothetical protein